MVVLIVFTVFFHITINSGYGPLVDYLPLSVAPKISAIQNQGMPEPTDSRYSVEEKRDQSSELPPPPLESGAR
jgi:calcium permeable stress-gated cation channel